MTSFKEFLGKLFVISFVALIAYLIAPSKEYIVHHFIALMCINIFVNQRWVE